MNCGCLLLLPSDWLYHVMNCPVHCSSFTHDFCNINFLVFQYHQKKKISLSKLYCMAKLLTRKEDKTRWNLSPQHHCYLFCSCREGRKYTFTMEIIRFKLSTAGYHKYTQTHTQNHNAEIHISESFKIPPVILHKALILHI